MYEERSLQNLETCANVTSNFDTYDKMEKAELLARPSDVGVDPTGNSKLSPSISPLENITQDFSTGSFIMSKKDSKYCPKDASLGNENAERQTRHLDLGVETLENTVINPSVSAPVLLTQHKKYGSDMSKNSDRKPYIMLLRSARSEFLLKNHPNAFLLLCQIAYRAKRTLENDERILGEAYIGDFKNAGIASISKYKTAKNTLIRLGFIEILETCRQHNQNLTTSISTKGTLVKLLNLDVFDPNFETDSHLDRQEIATWSPPDRHEQEYKNIRKEEESLSYDKDIDAIASDKNSEKKQNSKKPRAKRSSQAERENSPYATGEKKKFGIPEYMNVILYEGEYTYLIKEFEFQIVREKIRSLSSRLAQGKTKSKNHFATLLEWLHGDKDKESERTPKIVNMKSTSTLTPENVEPKFVPSSLLVFGG